MVDVRIWELQGSKLCPIVVWNYAAFLLEREKLVVLDRASKPKAAISIAIIQPVRQLVFAAAELEGLKTTAPAEWKKRVVTQASSQDR